MSLVSLWAERRLVCWSPCHEQSEIQVRILAGHGGPGEEIGWIFISEMWQIISL